MTDIYLHGIETVERDTGPRPVVAIDSGIIGLVGTAPDALAADWPLDTAVPIFGASTDIRSLGETGTLKEAIEGIFDQATRVSQTIVVIRVEEVADPAQQLAKVIGDRAAYTGVQGFLRAHDLIGLTPKILIAPGFTSSRPANGVSSVSLTDGGSAYTEAPEVTLSGDGAGAAANAVLNSETGEISAVLVTNPGSGYTTPPTVSFAGGGGTGAAATAVLGTVANPVAMELLVIANRIRAGVIVDGPNTNSTDAVTYRLDYNSERPMLIVDPHVQVNRNGVVVSEPASARIAGLQARIDYERGFWHSPSNKVIEGIGGTARTIGHSISDPSAESQYLNKNAVSAIVRSKTGGFKLWGSRMPNSDPLKVFWSVRRAHDVIIESIEIAHEPFIDEPFNMQVLVDIAETVNSALRRWQALGATLGGKVWLDPGLNTKESWVNGHLYVSYDAEAPAPIEHITFLFSRNTGYYERLAENAIEEIARISGSAL